MRQQTHGASSDDRLQKPIPGGMSFDTSERRQVDHTARIAGWGSDVDPETRPGVPRDKAPHIGAEHLYIDITRQKPPHRIHKSTEHGQLTPVFGTSCPPKGLSGRIRDFAYRLSEGRPTRWMTLIFADRVDMVEGVLQDLARMRPPNVVREMGLQSEWRHNRPRVIKVAVVTALVAAAYLIRRSRAR